MACSNFMKRHLNAHGHLGYTDLRLDAGSSTHVYQRLCLYSIALADKKSLKLFTQYSYVQFFMQPSNLAH